MPITENDIRDLATQQSYERGEDYYYTQAVSDIQKRGNMLIADVAGSSYVPYHVTIELTDDKILSTSCTCPYDWGGICKHIAAVLLSYLHQPKQVDERPSIEELLSNPSEADLRALLLDLLTAEPHLLARVDMKLAALATPPQKKSSKKKKKDNATKPSVPRPAPIDPKSFRQQSQQILVRPDRREDYDAGWDISNQMTELFKQAQPFLETNDGRNALLVLEAIMEPFIDCWYDYDHEGEVGEVFINTAPLFTEAILSTDLSKDERQLWDKKLEGWQSEISDYGVDNAFDAAIAAVAQGWDYPPLQAVFQGNITDKGAWEGEAPDYADDLAIARLNVLERQKRTQDYLYLAEAEGQTALYLTMLVKAGRSEEAVKYALKYVGTTNEAFALTLALYEYDHALEAIKMAEHGLTLQGDKLSLARWLRDVDRKQSKPAVALNAAKIAFTNSFLIEDYKAVESISGSDWPSVKPDLLAKLSAAKHAFEKIDIYLYEGMVDKAMKAVDRRGSADYHTVEKVVDAVWQSHPKWVIKHSKKQAEPIMDEGKSKYYHHAVRWLEKAGKAYLAADRKKEWQTYLEGLIEKHARKYSLRPKLEGLRRISL